MIDYGCPVGSLSIKKIPFFPMLQPTCDEVLPGDSERQVEEVFLGRDTLGTFQQNQKFKPIDRCHNDHCNHFPALLSEDGSPWVLGNLYLMELAKGYPQPHDNTLYKTAQALKDFWKVLSDENVGIFDFPLRLRRRATYCYSYYWKRVVDENPEAEEGANEKINKVTDFYRWAVSEKYLAPANEMWVESEKSIVIKNHYGREFIKRVRVTDLTVKSSGTRPPKKLKPYGENDQIAIEQALIAIDNTEMNIAFALSLTTSARKQTVLTLKRSAFDSYNGQETFRVNVGHNQYADTKRQKRFPIFIPGWLARQIVIYISSERYRTRLARMRPGCDTDYIFITQSGLPYYARKDDPGRQIFQAIPVGKALDAFVRQQLTPRLREMGYSTNVRFHNLRATYANNLVRGNLELIESGDMKMADLIILVMDRLGQSSPAVAEEYIGSIQAEKLSYIAQNSMEKRLQAGLESGEGKVDKGDM
ncbi:hypothetical protein [Pseudomonas coleopterorum]|uniref:Phage integrase family protein n=1 Tax=Pseudomonas coleopterorum TaxID=1605838 RepID=A0AAJ6M221_9PSED|nr:hypothetical protein [Pseudomonas coleopterorum]WNC10936.1 hypothetical protein RI108_05815 [Pseudomonas coleopterorum]